MEWLLTLEFDRSFPSFWSLKKEIARRNQGGQVWRLNPWRLSGFSHPSYIRFGLRQVVLHLGLPTLFSRCREVPLLLMKHLHAKQDKRIIVYVVLLKGKWCRNLAMLGCNSSIFKWSLCAYRPSYISMTAPYAKQHPNIASMFKPVVEIRKLTPCMQTCNLGCFHHVLEFTHHV
jgi:hypothetical protein